MVVAIKHSVNSMGHAFKRECFAGRVCVFPAVFAVNISCCNRESLNFFNVKTELLYIIWIKFFATRTKSLFSGVFNVHGSVHRNNILVHKSQRCTRHRIYFI
jgi:hypothetical protein